MRDLRISLIDQCNMRCRYCMPADVFGPNYPFLSAQQLLSFDQIIRVIQAGERLGVSKLRLTGGEPLMRKEIDALMARIRQETGIRDLAITTNGLLLERQAKLLKNNGLARVNLSLDAIELEPFRRMSGGYGRPELVIRALDSALDAGLHVKINSVIKRGVNDDQILPLLQLGIDRGVEVRFIEYMDVGASNGWTRADMFSEAEILERVERGYGRILPMRVSPTAVARNFELEQQGLYKWGIIASVTRPFCAGCVRARISSDGHLFTCLFNECGHDLREYLNASDRLFERMKAIWLGRNDRYSELRGSPDAGSRKVEMSSIGG